MGDALVLSISECEVFFGLFIDEAARINCGVSTLDASGIEAFKTLLQKVQVFAKNVSTEIDEVLSEMDYKGE